MKTGLIGLGNLGYAIAERLIATGENLVVWNRTASKAKGLNCPIAGSPAELASECDTILINLFDTAAVHAVLTAEKGVLSGEVGGKVIVDTTTNDYRGVEEFYGLCRDRGVAYLECPVAGSVIPARSGQLTMLTSGDRKDLERVRPLMDKFARVIHYLPAPTMATRMKLINNLVLGTFMSVISEAVVLAEGSGLERSEAVKILSDGAGNSGVLKAKAQRLLDSDYHPHFSISAIHKDLTLLVELTDELGYSSHCAEAVREVFDAAKKAGRGEDDFCAVLEQLRESSD